MITSLPGPVRRWSRSDRWFERAFLNELTPSLSPPHADQIPAQASALFTSEQSTVSDAPSQMLLLLVCYVLAAYRGLVGLGIPPETAKQQVTRALIEPNRRAAHFFTRATLLFSRDRLATIRRTTERLEQTVYGHWFTFRYEDQGPTGFVAVVERCGLYDLLARHGEPGLTEAFCAWDSAWSSAISPGRHGVRFEMEGTIAQGCSSCRFCFTRADAA
ncbi:MAG: L-2-amino-thiazoline-4-carboxylic acid hydrolase [Bacteroidota bacterium]